MKKTSDWIKEIRALRALSVDCGDRIPGIYDAHISAMETERRLMHAREIVKELYTKLKGSVEGPCLTDEREDEIAGLLLLWDSE